MSAKHPEGSGYAKLKAQQSLGDILDTASAFEKTAYEFYSALQDKVSKPLRPLLKELVLEEKGHYNLFQALKQKPDVQSHIADLIKTPPSDHKFSDYIQLPELDEENLDDQSILQYAMGREQAAMEQYSSLAVETPPGEIQNLFRYLAQEELEHKRELEKRYYDLIHSGGV